MRRSHGATARRRLLISLGFGVVGAVVAALLGAGASAGLVGWELLALSFCVSVWSLIWRSDAAETSEHANRDDPSRDIADLIILCAAGASVVAVGAVLFQAKHRSSATPVEVAIALTSIMLSWLLVHTVFTLKYARLYYVGEDGGVDFNQDEPPRYSDFAYLAFTIGMTFQVSDTDITSTAIRRTALRQALIGFPLVVLITAAAINLVAGLA